MKAEPVEPAPGYCPHCKQYTIEEPLPAEPQSEPVVWIQPDHLQKAQQAPFLCRVEPTKRMSDFIPLYAAPQQRKPLSADQIRDAVNDHAFWATSKNFIFRIARAIECAHGITGEPT